MISEAFIGSATDPPREWPVHVIEDHDHIGVHVYCCGCRTQRYVCAGPVRTRHAQADCWAFAEAHRRCGELRVRR